MSSASPLSMAFIDKKPLTAARTLAAMEPDDAAAFLGTIPARYAASVFSHIGAWPASALLTKMDAARGAAALRELDFPNAAAILRLVTENNRAGLLTQLPEKLRRDFVASLTFPTDTVGAQMTTTILTLDHDSTIADAIGQARQIRGTNAEVGFIIDKSKKLVGLVSLAALLRYPARKQMGDIMDTNVASLSARARLSAVASLEAWDDYAQLPVLSRQKHVIGALSRKLVLQKSNHYALTDVANPTSIAASIASAFFMSGIGLAQLLADAEQRPVSLDEKGKQL